MICYFTDNYITIDCPRFQVEFYNEIKNKVEQMFAILRDMWYNDTAIANVKISDKQVGQGSDSCKGFVGAAALGGPLAAILRIAIT